MEINIALPTAVEGDWEIRDAEGKVLVSSQDSPGATISLKPRFYAGQYSQQLANIVTRGSKGHELKQALKVSASAGKITAEMIGKAPKLVTPGFDKKPPGKDKA
jgi:hypothetical protein